jgi:acetylornithine deacetylase/succinyl-diaminopimelate desuccinylase-like protein
MTEALPNPLFERTARLPDPGRLPVLDGLGPVGGGMHTREEYVELRSLQRRIVLLADLLAETR